MNLLTNTDIVNDALNRAGELINGTSSYEAKALEYVNRVYLAICSGGAELDPDMDERWWWLRSEFPNALTMEPVIEDGSLSVTMGSTAVVFSTAPIKSLRGWFLRTTSTQDVFRIVAHDAGDGGATLDSQYTGVTSGGQSYTAFKLEYDLPANCMEILSPMRTYQDGKRDITGMELSALEERYPVSEIWQGVPEAFAMVGNRRVRFSHQGGAAPDDLIRIDFDFLVLPGDLLKDSNEPLVPREFRRVIADYAAFFILLDKSDNKATDVGAAAKAGLKAMSKEQRKRLTQFSGDMGGIFPRQHNKMSSRFPLRTTGGRIIGW